MFDLFGGMFTGMFGDGLLGEAAEAALEASLMDEMEQEATNEEDDW